MAQTLFTRGRQHYRFSKSSQFAILKKFKMGSIGILKRILANSFGKIHCNGMYLLPHLLEELLLILFLGISLAQKRNCGQIFIPCVLSKIKRPELQFVDEK